MNSDVDFAYRPHFMADVTGLPLADESVDVVYANQVLEHVYDLQMAAGEIERVLKVGGLVIVGVPFMYPWHGVPYDFTRLTPCGLRAAFPNTEIVSLDRDAGSWAALAVKMRANAVGAFPKGTLRRAAFVVSTLLLSPIKHIDRIAQDDHHMISALGFTYVGRKTERAFSPREIMAELRARYAHI
jgi:SAM-dependent methyltransferase